MGLVDLGRLKRGGPRYLELHGTHIFFIMNIFLDGCYFINFIPHLVRNYSCSLG